jgi:hypothetical protein
MEREYFNLHLFQIASPAFCLKWRPLLYDSGPKQEMIESKLELLTDLLDF